MVDVNMYTVPIDSNLCQRLLLKMISPMQVRMARAALGWGVRELGMKAGISANTVSSV